ncbi:MAG: DUF4350 domain-containing protein [Candidatus Dormibacteria bacterium]
MSRRIRAVVALLGALVVVALVGLIGAASPPRSDADPSSRIAGRAGTLALYTWLHQLGFQVDRLSGSFRPDGHDVLVIDQPTSAISEDDLARVQHFVAGGGDVILAVDGETVSRVELLLSALQLHAQPAAAGTHAGLVQPIDAGDRVHRVPISTTALAFDDAPGVAPLLADGQAVVGVAVGGGRGRGRAYVLGSALPLSNDGLRQDDSAGLVLTLLERARGGRVVFDEYHHGEVDAPGAATIFKGPLGAASIGAVLVAVLYLALSGRRLGRPIPAGDASLVPSASAYVDSMAALVARSRLRGGVADRYADELKRRVGGIAGVDPRLPDAGFLDGLRGYSGTGATEVASVLGRARELASLRPSEGALLELARRVDTVEREWAGAAAGSQWPP